MKKTITKIGGVLLAMTMMISPAFASTPEAEFNFNSMFGKITGYTGTSKDITIPTSINSETVSKIVGLENLGLESVTLSGNPIEIEGEAFKNNSLTTIHLNGVSKLGWGSFKQNPSLESINFNGSTFTTIDSHTFDGCNLTKVVLREGITEVGQYAFTNNPLTQVYIPESLTSIDPTSFDKDGLTLYINQNNNDMVQWAKTNAFTYKEVNSSDDMGSTGDSDLPIPAGKNETVLKVSTIATDISMSVPINFSMVLDPNTSSETLSDKVILTNTSKAPINVSLKSVGKIGDAPNLTEEDKDWNNLNKTQSSQFVKMTLVGDQLTQNNKVIPAEGSQTPIFLNSILPNGELSFTCKLNHGRSFTGAEAFSYKLVYEIELA